MKINKYLINLLIILLLTLTGCKNPFRYTDAREVPVNADERVQKNIEDIIKKNVPSYNYGKRREDQTPLIENSKLFGPVQKISSKVIHEQTISECVEAWRSHATLERQAGNRFSKVVDEIEKYLKEHSIR